MTARLSQQARMDRAVNADMTVNARIDWQALDRFERECRRHLDTLTPEYKAIIECASAVAHTDMQAKYDAKNPVALKQLVAGGTKLFRFPKDVNCQVPRPSASPRAMPTRRR